MLQVKSVSFLLTHTLFTGRCCKKTVKIISQNDNDAIINTSEPSMYVNQYTLQLFYFLFILIFSYCVTIELKETP